MSITAIYYYEPTNIPLRSQDTNTMQYELMKAIALGRSVTIVGDPDQSSEFFDIFLYNFDLIMHFSIRMALSRSHKFTKDETRYAIF